jgi:hypothetical protein
MKNYKTKIKHTVAEGIEQLMAQYIQMEQIDMDDKLVMATLNEVRLTLLRKMLQPKPMYQLTLSPAQAIAFSIWYNDYLGSWDNQIKNAIHNISNEIQKLYT